MRAACVIGSNYLPHARVLAASFARYHPRGHLSVLVVDCEGAPLPDIPGAEVLEPADVGVARDELHRRAVLFDPQGVISSLRPLLLAHELGLDAEAVLLLDADMLVLAPMDDVWRMARGTGVLLSPHSLVPRAGRPGAWAEEELLRAGTFSGGFLGVGQAGRDFLVWLAERAARDCLKAPERGLLYTQTWLTLVPALFEHRVLRDPGVNAQIHGLAGEDVRWEDGILRLGPTALRLYHFSGFDPARPDRLCRYYADDDTLADRPGLLRLCSEYAALLRDAGWPGDARWPFTATASGLAVDAPLRRAYRDGILAAERAGAPLPPDPFDAAAAATAHAWLREPAAGGVSRYLLALHAVRPDLKAAFPQVPGAGEPAYLEWAARKAAEAGQVEVPRSMAPQDVIASANL